ncbi:MAG: SIMPL domain-containing protein [Candidatus Nealsonbacteria bacterium]|nr:SIMPL domain-containing protein [Candidatus Nealsonbacteria bacterium]
MNRRTCTILSAAALLITLLSIALSPATALAQAGAATLPAGTVEGVGNVTLKQPATIVRMHLQLTGKGKTLEESFEKLKIRRGEATAKLEKLAVDTDSIEWGTPGLSAIESAYQQQFEALVRQRLSSGQSVPKGLKIPRTVTTTVSLNAEWPIAAEGHEKLLVAMQALQKQIRDADLAGLKQPEKLSPEEQELAEEMAAMMEDSGEGQPPVGEPSFVYVARITDQQVDDAMAEAFKKARLAATRLARAAGMTLGPLASLSGSGGGAENTDDDEYYGGGFYGGSNYARMNYIRQMMAMRSSSDPDDQQNESIAIDPAALTFQFYVKATFRIGE